MQLADVRFGKIEVHLFEKNRNLNFPEVDVGQRHMAPPRHSLAARAALKCVGADKARAAISTGVSWVSRRVQVAAVSSGKIEAQFSFPN